jgi:hypothetical protein
LPTNSTKSPKSVARSKLQELAERPTSGHPFNKKVEAVDLWLRHGNLHTVAKLTKIPYETMRLWHIQPWWKDLENEVKQAKTTQQIGKLGVIVDSALDTIADRLENGEVFYDQKSGQLKRKPVGLRDATGAATALMQRQAAVEKAQNNQATAVQTQTIKEQLTNLAIEFAKFNSRSKSAAVDVSFKEIPNAIYDERETRLQEGEREVRLQASGSEEAGRAE